MYFVLFFNPNSPPFYFFYPKATILMTLMSTLPL